MVGKFGHVSLANNAGLEYTNHPAPLDFPNGIDLRASDSDYRESFKG